MNEYDDLARIVANLSKKMCFNFESLKHGFSCSRRVGRPAVADGGGATSLPSLLKLSATDCCNVCYTSPTLHSSVAAATAPGTCNNAQFFQGTDNLAAKIKDFNNETLRATMR